MEKKIAIYAAFLGICSMSARSLMQSAKGLHGYSFELDGEPPFDWELGLKILSDLQPKAAKKIKYYT